MSTSRPILLVAACTLALLAATVPFRADDAVVVTKEIQQAMTPDEALTALQSGNERFVMGKPRERDLMAQAHATAGGQFPFAAVLGCIDSRVPPELVFDQGLGDIFSARIAGNFANTDMLGSLEFATSLSGAKLVMVLGHTECGAIRGACDGADVGNLTATLANLMPAVEKVSKDESIGGERNSKNKAFVQAVADENVRLTVRAMTERSELMAELVRAGLLEICGAMYDVQTGRVTLVE